MGRRQKYYRRQNTEQNKRCKVGIEKKRQLVRARQDRKYRDSFYPLSGLAPDTQPIFSGYRLLNLGDVPEVLVWRALSNTSNPILCGLKAFLSAC